MCVIYNISVRRWRYFLNINEAPKYTIYLWYNNTRIFCRNIFQLNVIATQTLLYEFLYKKKSLLSICRVKWLFLVMIFFIPFLFCLLLCIFLVCVHCKYRNGWYTKDWYGLYCVVCCYPVSLSFCCFNLLLNNSYRLKVNFSNTCLFILFPNKRHTITKYQRCQY